MKKITVKLSDIKDLKKMMDELDILKEKSLRVIDEYQTDYSGKEKLIKYHEDKINREVSAIYHILNISHDTIIDMCYDFNFAKPSIVLELQNFNSICTFKLNSLMFIRFKIFSLFFRVVENWFFQITPNK